MGTNYYFITQDKNTAHKFADIKNWGIDNAEYELIETPYVGFRIHLNKLSYGWKPLFQIHKPFCTWDGLRNFYLNNKDFLDIYDEYDRKYTWEEYSELIFDHANVTKRPLKWVYEKNKLFGGINKSLDLKNCSADEADIFTPLSHAEYFKSESKARKKFNIYTNYDFFTNEYREDPNGKIDWVEGEFS